MSKDDKRLKQFLKSCAGKVRYSEFLSAQYFLENNHSKVGSEIYPCSHCHGYHIGKSGSREKDIEVIIKIRNKEKKNEHKHKHRKFKY